MNVNPQQTNQFLNYQNYHHDQLIHHQYFDENPHAQNYSNFVPYNTSNEYASTPVTGEPVHHQENFAAMHSNELYEFLPEEIFQLDQPILKSESQTFTTNAPQNLAIASSMENIQLQFNGHSGDVTSTSHSFLDLSSGQIQTNMKYPPSSDGFAGEINNNSNYHSSGGVQVNPKAVDVTSYTYQVNQEVSTRLNAVESEKSLKRKHFDIDPVVKHNPPALQQNFLNQQLFSKRENSCLQQTTGYYPPDLYTSFPSKPNDVYRTMEKFNYITNN
jgi:hypothetical protein